MNDNRMLRSFFAIVICLSFAVGDLHAQNDKESPRYQLQYFMDATIFSIGPDQTLESLIGYGEGGVGPNGTLTLGASHGERRFDVTMRGKLKSGRFTVDVAVIPEDDQTQPLEKSYDLTSLTPFSVELARDEDGRIFQLNLVPRIIRNKLATPFNADDLKLTYFTFDHSDVLLNDQDYLGQMNMGSNELAYLDIPGLALIEFSLRPLLQGKPEGILKNGLLTIHHEDGTQIRISNVLNGIQQQRTLGEEPYQVWVRWLPPTQTVDEYKTALGEQLQMIRRKIENGEMEVSEAIIRRLQQAAESGRVMHVSSGLGPLRRDDRELNQNEPEKQPAGL